MNPPTPRERRQQRTRDAILDAARSIIIKDGVDALSMRKIAHEIDYSAAGLYEYFESKDEIIHALATEADQRLTVYMKAVDTALPIVKRLIELGMGYVQFAVNNREMFLVFFNNLATGTGQEHEDQGNSFKVLLATVQEGVDAGVIHGGEFDAFSISYAAWAFVHGMAMLQLTALKDAPYNFDPVNRWALAQFIEGLQTP